MMTGIGNNRIMDEDSDLIRLKLAIDDYLGSHIQGSEMKRLYTIFPKVYNRKKRVTADDMRAAGYPEARPSDQSHMRWREMHQWCHDKFGENYVWFGSAFFFTNMDDQILFRLMWS